MHAVMSVFVYPKTTCILPPFMQSGYGLRAAVFRKVAFCLLKDHILHAKRPPFRS